MAIRWIQDGEPHVAEVYNRPLRDFVAEVAEDRVPSTRTISVGNGLTGGGILNTNMRIDGLDATKTAKGVTRFATREEAIAGDLQNVAVDPQALADAVAQNATTQPTITGNYTATGSVDNKITLIGIVPELVLEIGDVIQISGSTDGLNDKLYTVESITDDNSIIVNYEHAGNRTNGSLKLDDQLLVGVVIKRIAKWYDVSIGVGQSWVNMTESRSVDVTYTNTSGRTIFIYVAFSDTASTGLEVKINGTRVFKTDDLGAYSYHPVAIPIPAGNTYNIYNGADITGGNGGGGGGRGTTLCWLELR